MRALLLFLLALTCNSALASRGMFQALCEDRMAGSRAIVKSRLNGYRIDNTLSFRELPAKSQKPAPVNGAVLGVTATKYATNIGYSAHVMRNPISRYECVSSQIEVTVSYEPTVIYIGKEFLPGTCAYREILAHEMRHLNTYFEQLPKVEIAVREALVRRFNVKAEYGPAGQAQAALKREVENVWVPFFTAQIKRADALHDVIDTPQEYARLSRVCQGEVQSFIAPNGQTNRTP
ncbi:hypothetical protein [Massilia sp. CF038]|uniref:hypothetical protein n=1 Tax=Massilia sp. CF038 TaxID=1881045 RepID=UPI00090FC26E|nr:hypothetical protein [Massilia sp. CF038]SHG56359.1 hypothetical protein SAMN05428948_1044 [Massilia sp. CF038]